MSEGTAKAEPKKLEIADIQAIFDRSPFISLGFVYGFRKMMTPSNSLFSLALPCFRAKNEVESNGVETRQAARRSPASMTVISPSINSLSS